MVLTNKSLRLNTRLLPRLAVPVLLLILLPLSLASAQDYEAVAKRLQKSVKKGEITAQQADTMMAALKTSAVRKEVGKKRKAAHSEDTSDIAAAWRRMQALVKQGKLTREEARAQYDRIMKAKAKQRER